ncbi:translation initiation factor Sui1 [Pseudoduganella danionis]|uniref:translation initiation factor Sui1 n=1 Tax=Pseudoduganella danionis TaxID=1890295 RepID=UPI0035B3E2CF
MNSSRLVYSTETGRICPACSQPVAQCRCKAAALARPQGDGNIKVSRESKGRGGKTVTLVKGMALDADALSALGKQLRSACGSGGTVKEGVIEIQGDHCERVMEALQKQGYQPKRVGG